jgi:hypothetical protein
MWFLLGGMKIYCEWAGVIVGDEWKSKIGMGLAVGALARS